MVGWEGVVGKRRFSRSDSLLEERRERERERERARAWLRADMPGCMSAKRWWDQGWPLPFAPSHSAHPVDRDSRPRLHDFGRGSTTSGLYPPCVPFLRLCIVSSIRFVFFSLFGRFSKHGNFVKWYNSCFLFLLLLFKIVRKLEGGGGIIWWIQGRENFIIAEMEEEIYWKNIRSLGV